MSYIGQQTNSQSLNGIIDLTDGTITIVDGDISNVNSLSINGEINMNTNKIINLDDGVSAGDAVNKSQLDAVSINLNDYLRRDGTNALTGNLNFASNKIINLATGTASTDSVNKGQMDTQSSLKLNKSGDIMTGNLDMNTTNKIINVSSGTNNFDVINKLQMDTQDNLRVLKNGDTMTGNLNMNTTNKIINLATPTLGTDAANKNYVDSHTTNPNYVLKTGDTMTGVLTIDKNSTIFTNFNVTSSQTIEIKSGNPLFDLYTLTYNGTGTQFMLPYNGQSDTTLQNKTVAFKITGGTQVFLTGLPLVGSFTTIIVDGVNYVSTILTKSSSFILKGTGTIGSYTTHPFQEYFNTDQLTLKSSLGTDANTEFTGIRFLNTTSDAGFIRTTTNRTKTSSTMSFQVRQSNIIANAFEIGDTINAFEPIIRSAWSSGELINTQIYNQTTSGTGILTIAPSGVTTYINWKTLSYTLFNTPTDSIIVVEVFAPYVSFGTGADKLLSRILDNTSSQVVAQGGQAFYGTAGGGSRGLALIPLMGSYTPTGTSKTRSIRIQFDNASDDQLHICKVQGRTALDNIDIYTIKISEYKK